MNKLSRKLGTEYIFKQDVKHYKKSVINLVHLWASKVNQYIHQYKTDLKTPIRY